MDSIQALCSVILDRVDRIVKALKVRVCRVDGVWNRTSLFYQSGKNNLKFLA